MLLEALNQISEIHIEIADMFMNITRENQRKTEEYNAKIISLKLKLSASEEREKISQKSADDLQKQYQEQLALAHKAELRAVAAEARLDVLNSQNTNKKTSSKDEPFDYLSHARFP